MIKSLIRNVIEIDQNTLKEQRFAFLKSVKKKLLFTIPLAALLIVLFKMLLSINHELLSLDKQRSQKISEIKGYILKNNYVDKAINDMNELNLSMQNQDSMSLDKFKNIISYLSYYYKISGPLIIKNIPIDNQGHLKPVRFQISMSAKEDSKIIQFVDSLITNLDGFVLIQKIDISRNNGNISGEAVFDWYTTRKIGNALKSSSIIAVEPRIFDGQLEDNYRISVWNGTIVSNK